MSDQHIDETGPLRRGKAPVSGISVPGQVGFGSLLTHSLDYVVILHLLFSIAEGSSPTPLKVWEELKARGIRSSKNVEELVGKNAVYESFGRLIAAGLVRRVEVLNKVPGRRPTIAYDVYDNPAWNPDWQAQQVGSDPLAPTAPKTGDSGNSQVSPRPGTPDMAFGDVAKLAGQPTSRNARHGVRGSGVPGRGNRRVPAGQPTSGVPGRGNVSPPHPPEEVTTSSPYPLTDTTGHTSLPSQKEGEGAGYAEEDLRAAADVFQLLPDPWTQGRLNATKLAPKLLAVMAEQGWPGIHTVERRVLVRQLTKNPHKVTNPYRLLAGDRVPNLPRYAVVSAEAARSRPAGATADGMCPKHPQYRAGSRCIPCVSA
ncbi:hypothetical protein AB0L80_38745 [Streptomyces sp. NPDC052069]|uniref:hypothetical protein n=1 Tax=Streptomyces sp. NPDC052069 TaxID=3154650 RepID=UPI00342DAEE9